MLLRCQKMWTKMRSIDLRPKNKIGSLIYDLLLTILNMFEIYYRKLPLLLFEIYKNKKNISGVLGLNLSKALLSWAPQFSFHAVHATILSDHFELSRIDSRI